MSLLISSGGGGGPITASDITDSSASGRTVLTGTSSEARTALGVAPSSQTLTLAHNDDAAAHGMREGGSVPVTRTATSETITLTAKSDQVQSIVPEYAIDVNLPAESGTWCFVILNAGSTYNITVKRAGGTTLTTLAPGDQCFATFDGTTAVAY